MEHDRTYKDEELPRRPKRVLRIIARMNVGGPAIQIAELMTNIPNKEFEQLLITGFCDENESDYLDSIQTSIPHVRIKGLSRSLNLFNDVSAFFDLRRIMKRYRPDIVHTHTAKAGLLGRLASLSTFGGHIRVHTFHGHLLHGYFSSFKTRAVVLIEKCLGIITTSIVTVGDKVKNDLLDHGIGRANKYTVIGPGLSLQTLPIRIEAEKSLGIVSGKFNVTWIGRAVKVKSPMRLVGIAKETQKQDLGVDFLIVGDGPLIQDMKDEAHKKQLNITFLGWQNYIERVLAVSDIVILTSENEGTPVALIQAQMAGIPVITSDVGSASEVLIHGKSGFCETYSEEVFVNRIKELKADQSKRIHFGQAATEFALKKFSLQNLIDSHRSLYQKLIDQSN
jgi:glycosyltransferase involved in cell wall biosynthesis